MIEEQADAGMEPADPFDRDFAASVVHELRNPLNVIIGWAELLLRRQYPDAALSEGLAAIERAAKTQAQLLTDLLDILDITSGKARLDIDMVDPLAVVESAVHAAATAAQAGQVAIERTTPEAIDWIPGDALRLQQAVWSLLTNAIRSTPRGGRIRIGIVCSGSQVEIVVADDGRGIEPELLPHVFDRPDRSGGRRRSGYDLGLAIVRHLVEMHGGTVSAHSEGRDRGSRFVMRLPTASCHGA